MLHGKEAVELLRNHILQDYTVLDTLISILFTLDVMYWPYFFDSVMMCGYYYKLLLPPTRLPIVIRSGAVSIHACVCAVFSL